MYLPPKYQRLTKHGRNPAPGAKWIRANFDRGFGETERYFKHQYDPGLALELIQAHVRQGFSAEKIERIALNPKNTGFLWIRHQNFPKKAVAEMIAKVDHNRKPILSRQQRIKKIKTLLSTGEVFSQRKLINAVDNPNYTYTRSDLRTLALMGVIQMIPEQHGKRTWFLVALAAPLHLFDAAVKSIGLELKAKLSPRYADRTRVKIRPPDNPEDQTYLMSLIEGC